MDSVSKKVVVAHGGVMVVCTLLLALLMAQGNARLQAVEDHTRSMAGDTREMASSTRIHYEPSTFQLDMSDQRKKYEEGHGIPACAEFVRAHVNGDGRGLRELVQQGYYVMNTTTHTQTGNQTNFDTGRLKPESETGYKSCHTTGLLYVLRKDLGEFALDGTGEEAG